MNWLVYHIVSGHAFFTGVFLVTVAAICSTRSHAILSRTTVLAFLVGVIAVVVSSTAIPYGYYGAMLVVTVMWVASRFRKSWRRWAPYAVVGVWLIAALIELPYHIISTPHAAPDRSVTVIGDSVTAGVGGSETAETWPRILAREHQLQVQDISHVGETVASALKRARSKSIESSVVVIEIGGNDVLGTTTSAQFANDLEALVAYLATQNRQIIMFELPLPPFYHEYGRVQRSIAARYDVFLVPKRVFLSVLGGSDSTLDTIHLTQRGHQSMAESVWRLIEPAFDGQGGV